VRDFGYEFLENGLLPANLVNITSSISELKALEGQRKADFGEIFLKLESVAKVQSVKGSNEIEGIITSDDRIDAIVNRSSTPLNHNEAEIAGYRDALNLIHGEYANLDFRESDILRLHRLMLTYSPVPGGKYKENDNVIMEISANGSRRVRFSPTPAAETKEAMEQLVLAYLEARGSYGVNQLLLIPCVILDFLCIHPFSDGNGRMSRLLSLLLLYKSGFDAGRYISFEGQINRTKARYYHTLKESSAGWHANQNSCFPFMEYFLSTLLMCYRELDRRFASVRGGGAVKRRRIEATVLDSLSPISKAEICQILPDVSPTTIEAVLGAMLKAGAVKKIGAGRSTRYLRNS
jgi:Fic family protein